MKYLDPIFLCNCLPFFVHCRTASTIHKPSTIALTVVTFCQYDILRLYQPSTSSNVFFRFITLTNTDGCVANRKWRWCWRCGWRGQLRSNVVCCMRTRGTYVIPSKHVNVSIQSQFSFEGFWDSLYFSSSLLPQNYHHIMLPFLLFSRPSIYIYPSKCSMAFNF